MASATCQPTRAPPRWVVPPAGLQQIPGWVLPSHRCKHARSIGPEDPSAMRHLAMLLCSCALMGAPAFAQEPEQPHVVLKPAKDREARDDPTMALTPGPEQDKNRRPAAN